MGSICGRGKELTQLERVFSSNQAEFIAIYGRRRIGKTYLIHEFFKDRGIYFEVTGMQGAKLSEQLHQFTISFSETFHNGVLQPVVKSWMEAFENLRQAIKNETSKRRIILFFDELPWLATKRSGFLNALNHLWNRYLSRDPRIILVICGSAASWMIRHVINDRGGLHGRLSLQIRLLPFSLKEAEDYLHFRNIQLDRRQIVELYMAIGGVAKYLSYLPPGLSSQQAINELCFTPQGSLRYEFNKLYQSLFENHQRHIEIVKALASKRSGLDQESLRKKVNYPSGGGFRRLLDELLESGFIDYIPDFSKKKKGGHFRLIDEYSFFFLKWIAPTLSSNFQLDSEYWVKQRTTASWKAWSGYAFESLCLKHIYSLKQALGISGVTTNASGWFYQPKTEDDPPGHQIDLVIDRADHCIHLCEIKYYHAPYTLNAKEAQALENKREAFREVTQTPKSLFNTLIAPSGVKQNTYAQQSVDQSLDLEALFS